MNKKIIALLLSTLLLASCAKDESKNDVSLSSSLDTQSGDVASVEKTKVTENSKDEENTESQKTHYLKDFLYLYSYDFTNTPYTRFLYAEHSELTDYDYESMRVQDTSEFAGFYKETITRTNDYDPEAPHDIDMKITQINEDGTFSQYYYTLADSERDEEYWSSSDFKPSDYFYLDKNFNVQQLTGYQPKRRVFVRSGIVTQSYGELVLEEVEEIILDLSLVGGEYIFSDLNDTAEITNDMAIAGIMNFSTNDFAIENTEKIKSDKLEHKFLEPINGRMRSAYQLIKDLREENKRREDENAKLPVDLNSSRNKYYYSLEEAFAYTYNKDRVLSVKEGTNAHEGYNYNNELVRPTYIIEYTKSDEDISPKNELGYFENHLLEFEDGKWK